MLTKDFIAGFICGEGSFSQWEITQKERTYKVFRFCISQHEKEILLLQEIKESIGYGTVRKKSSPKNNPVYIEYIITKTTDLINFFKLFSPHLKGTKKEQALKWYKDLKGNKKLNL